VAKTKNNISNENAEKKMLNEKFLEELEEYLKSGRLEEDFEYSAEDRRYEILDYLERLMDIAELADEVATRLIFKNSQLGQLFNSNAQK
jgi:predicted house-cleaning noncanonical NTP pyrophosphatase (MazG superfamily)